METSLVFVMDGLEQTTTQTRLPKQPSSVRFLSRFKGLEGAFTNTIWYNLVTKNCSSDLVFEAGEGHGRAPLEVARDAARLEALAHPRLRDDARVGRPAARGPFHPRRQLALQLFFQQQNQSTQSVTSTCKMTRMECDEQS